MYNISAGIRSTRNQDGGIVLDIDRGQMFRLNPVGVLILESLEKRQTTAEISHAIASQYGISEETAAADVREFLQSLEEHRLVHTLPKGKVS